jgi:hypothetical protein
VITIAVDSDDDEVMDDDLGQGDQSVVITGVGKVSKRKRQENDEDEVVNRAEEEDEDEDEEAEDHSLTAYSEYSEPSALHQG